MAKLSTTRTAADGLRVHPVARVRAIIPEREPGYGPTEVRYTLRSDMAVLRAVRLSDRWTTPVHHATVTPRLYAAVMGAGTVSAANPQELLRVLSRRSLPGVVYTVEAVRPC